MKCGLDKEAFLQQAVKADAGFIGQIKSCLILAPHPDDESLGCGALIAILKENGCKINVIFTTDGSMSHPNSKTYPTEKRILLRQKEAKKALAILGVEMGCIDFMGAKDASFPFPGDAGFEGHKLFLSGKINTAKPQLVLVPYRLDPHCDHRATWQMLKEALKEVLVKPVVWEYPIWLYELAIASDVPVLKKGELKFITVDEQILDRKMKAIQAHVSQVSRLIDDDPTGFILLPGVIRHFSTSREYYIEKEQ